MGNVALSPGFVTKIWRVEWTEAELSAAPSDEALRQRSEARRHWCTRIAECDPSGTVYHWVLVRHFENGKVAVYVDGSLEGHGHAAFNSTELKYRVGERIVCTRVAFNETSKFTYTHTSNILNPDGSSIPLKELNEILINDHDPSILATNVGGARVEDLRRTASAAGKAVVFYEVTAQVRGDTEPICSKKRFSDFDDLDRKVRSAFSGSHLLSSLPSLPPKQSKVLSNHLDPAFIEGRRLALTNYLRKLLSVPRIAQNPDVLEFLGVLPTLTSSAVAPVVEV